MRARPVPLVAAIALTAAACAGTGAAPSAAPPRATAASEAAAETPAPAPSPAPTVTAHPQATPKATTRPSPAASEPPAWLGTRALPLDPDGFGIATETPPELLDRRIVTTDLLAPPPDGGWHAAVAPVPDDVAARSTWHPDCPVPLADLRYVTVSFHGIDGRAHTGELLVHGTVAEDMVEVFRRLFEARFPIEEMRVVAPAELDAPPTGDGNNTTAFVCRPVRGTTAWSSHARGLAVDVNPFHNPYVSRERILPELAIAYTDRDRALPGMIRAGDVVTEAFAAVGWTWGGTWTAPYDPMHFSADGR